MRVVRMGHHQRHRLWGTLPMYVCICHALTEQELQSALLQNAGCSRSTFKSLGYRPKCGKCVETIQSMVSETPAASTPSGLAKAS